MIFGYGPGSDMLKTYQQNNNLLSKRKGYGELSKQYPARQKSGRRNVKRLSEEELLAMRQYWAAQRRKETRKLIVGGMVAGLLLTGMVMAIF